MVGIRNSHFLDKGGEVGFNCTERFGQAKKGGGFVRFAQVEIGLFLAAGLPPRFFLPPPFIASSPPKTHSVAKILNYGPLAQVGGRKGGGKSFSVLPSRHRMAASYVLARFFFSRF